MKKLKALGSWEIDGETVETVSDFIFLGSKITEDGDCSHEIKRRLLYSLMQVSKHVPDSLQCHEL